MQGDLGNFIVIACNIYSTVQPLLKSLKISKVRLARFSANGEYELYELLIFYVVT